MIATQWNKLKELSIPVSTSWLLGDCMEARGKQDLWTRQRPEVLEALRELAIIQSAESSNRIEGVTIDHDRLRPVVLGKARPRDRSEEELCGYRKALDWIFALKPELEITPAVILHLHSLAQGGFSGDAGKWKARDNEIIEFLPSGERVIRFKPALAKETPRLMQTLCDQFQKTIEEGTIPPLLVIGLFVFDFLCIHPFRDGNGRVSRLLTTLLLRQNGFEVGKYVSLERIVEENKEDYYRVLKQCSDGWHEGKNAMTPWWNFFLGMVRRAYQQFAAQVESTGRKPAKGELVRNAVLAQFQAFTLADICAQLPGISVQQVKKTLAEMKAEGEITLTGRGRSARWTRGGT